MTIKQQQVLKLLPKNKYNISKTFKEVGYTEGSSRAGSLYASLRNSCKEAGIYDKDRIAEDEEKLWRKAEKAGDLTNLNRQIEGRRKVAGMITDRVDVKKAPDTIVIVDKSYRANTDEKTTT